MTQHFEAVVAGLGPAGMSAAIALAESGVKTAVIDDQPTAGGQVYRQLPDQFEESSRKTAWGPRASGVRLLARLKKTGRAITLFSRASIFGYFSDNEIAVVEDDELHDISYSKLIVCEGAMERTIPFPGWTLPGVLTAGGLQRLLKQQGVLAGQRILLAGSGPLLVSAAAELTSAGARVWLCEAAPLGDALRFVPAVLRHKAIWPEALGCLPQFLLRRINLMQPWGIIRAEGSDRVETAIVARLDPTGAPVPGTEKQLKVDVIGINHGFLPRNRLTRLVGCSHRYVDARHAWHVDTDQYQQTSLEQVYVAGDAAGIGGAHLASLQGQLAGLHAAMMLSGSAQNERLDALHHKTIPLQRYADSLFSCYRLRTGLFEVIEPDTTICRCEGVTASKIWDAVEAGRRSMVEFKPIRMAMGSCQGRVCESILTEMLKQRGIPPQDQGQLFIRPPLVPLPIATLAGDR